MNNKTRKARIVKKRAEYAAIKKHLVAKAAEISKLITDCPHDDQDRQSDPSGGNDHAYTCKACGKEW